MAYREKRNIDQTTSIPLSRLATPSEISSYIKRLITASQYDYHESEAMEVQSVTLNEVNNRGSVSGTFLNSGNFLENVKPLFGNMTTIPVIGEHVVVTEFNGQQYYSTIINRKGSTNENSIPGASGTYVENTKYGKTFERKKVKPIEIGEGCITFDGRFGQTLHFDGHDNTPKIKISTHVDESDGNFRKESIDNDDASIYLISRGMRDKFDGEQIEGKKVLIQSDGIFIKGRQEVKINAPNLSVIKDEVKLGSRDATQAVVLGDELKKILEDIASVLKLLPVAIDNTQSPLSAKDPQMVSKIAGLTLKINNMLSKKVKTI
jgi:hypothetical protein|tara:strand:+ start:45 stop:1004 length:960 start_codon:yes stop_codon:yes gene_type:complete